MTLPLPRNVIAKRLATGLTGFYFNVPTHFRKLGCTIANEPLGTDYVVACGNDGRAVEPRLSMPYSMNGEPSATASLCPALCGSGRLIGFSVNTNRAKHTLREFRSDRGPITSA
jgi:hypothetical protein